MYLVSARKEVEVLSIYSVSYMEENRKQIFFIWVHVFLIGIWVSFYSAKLWLWISDFGFEQGKSEQSWRLLRHVWCFLVEQQQQQNQTMLLWCSWYNTTKMRPSQENQSIIISTMIKITILSNNSGQICPSPANTKWVLLCLELTLLAPSQPLDKITKDNQSITFSFSGNI